MVRFLSRLQLRKFYTKRIFENSNQARIDDKVKYTNNLENVKMFLVCQAIVLYAWPGYPAFDNPVLIIYIARPRSLVQFSWQKMTRRIGHRVLTNRTLVKTIIHENVEDLVYVT